MNRFSFLAAAAAVSTLGFVGCDDSKSNMSTPSTTPPSSTSTDMQKSAEMHTDAAKDAADTAKAETEKAADATKENADAVAKDAKANAEAAKDATKENADAAADAAKKEADAAKDAADNVAK